MASDAEPSPASPAPTGRLQVDVRVPVGRPLPELAAFAALVESAGLDGVGVPDHHHTGRDAYLVLGAMASATSRISLYPATSNTVTRHPLVLAALANSLDELAPGRTILTVAPGFLSVEKAGEPQERPAAAGQRRPGAAGATGRWGDNVRRSRPRTVPPAHRRVSGHPSGFRTSTARACRRGGGWRHDAGRAGPRKRPRSARMRSSWCRSRGS